MKITFFCKSYGVKHINDYKEYVGNNITSMERFLSLWSPRAVLFNKSRDNLNLRCTFLSVFSDASSVLYFSLAYVLLSK